MIFNYDPAAMREPLARQGYAHLKDVLSDEFVGWLCGFLDDALERAANESAEWKIARKKRQFVFDFPSAEAAEEFRLGISRLTGIDPERLTISERHLKLYDEAADPWPAPHKDRSASHYSIGLPVRVAPGSSVCIFPGLDRTPNSAERAVFMDPADGHDPATLYESDQAVMLNEKPGDIVIFLGSALWHERVRPAGTAVLYIKINDEGDDPLGENLFARASEPA